MAMPAVLMISSILFAFVHYEISGAKVGLFHKKDFPLDVNTLRGKKNTLRGKSVRSEENFSRLFTLSSDRQMATPYLARRRPLS